MGGGVGERGAGGHGRRIALRVPGLFLLAEHDGRPGLHGAGGAHLRQMETRADRHRRLLFGFAEAVQIRAPGCRLWGGKPIPVQFIQILPYLVTILVLAGFVGRSRAPKALGTAFRRA